MSAAFPKRLRLSAVSDFQKVFDNAKRIRCAFLTLLYCSNGLPYSRIGLAVSNKHAGSVVKRNRIKRQIREYFRLHLAQIKGLDFVVISRKGIEQAEILEIKQNLHYFGLKLNTMSKT